MTRGSPSRSGPPPPVYQVDFTAASSGKRIGATKRRIRFRFGFANPEALNSGLTGVECRGEEHDVLCVWSVTSGKRHVIVDGHEVHHSITPGGKVQGKFEFSFNFRGQHVIQLVAHAGPPVGVAPNGQPQRQFDMFLNGQSFFQFAKIYELGMPMSTRGGAVPGSAVAVVSPQNSMRGSSMGSMGSYSNYSMDEGGDSYRRGSSSRSSYRHEGSMDYSQEYGGSERGHDDGYSQGPSFARPPIRNESTTPRDQEAPPACITPTNASDQSAVTAPTAVPQQEEPELLDLVSEPAPAPAVAPAPVQAPLQVQTQAPPAYQDQGWANPSAVTPTYPPAQQQQPPAYDGYNQQYQQQYNQQQQQQQPMGQYQFQQVSHEIMTKYEETPAPLQLTNEPANPDGTGPTSIDSALVPEETENKPPPQLTMENVNPFHEEERQEDQNIDALSKAMKDLVNVNDISSAPEKPLETKLTMNPEESAAEKNVVRDKKGNIVRSRGIAPPAEHWAGPQPSLDSMKTVRGAAPPATSGGAEVMKPPPPSAFHPSAVQAGALVVHGSAPGLEAPSGFGAGQYYAQQAQVAPQQQQQYYAQQQQGIPQYQHPVRS